MVRKVMCNDGQEWSCIWYWYEKVKCNHCGKFYIQYLENQVIGNRSKDEDICPYCNHVNGCSMDYEFHNYKIVK